MKYTIDEIPPSNNKYLGRGSKGLRFKYQEDKKLWEWLVRQSIGANKPKKPLSDVVVQLTYYFPTKHRRDPDNYSGKFILDGLVRSGIIEDDSFNCIDLQLEGKYDKDNPRTEIIIRRNV